MGGKATSTFVLVVTACALLGGCGTTGHTGSNQDSLDESDVVQEDVAVEAIDLPHEILPEVYPDIPTECEPSDGWTLSFEIDGMATPGSVHLEQDCTIESLDFVEPNTQDIFLECTNPDGTSATHLISISTSNPIAMTIYPYGQPVSFEYISDPGGWGNRWFAIRTRISGRIQLAAVDAETIAPPGIALSDWYTGLGIWQLEGLCPATVEDCLDVERLAIGFLGHGMYHAVFDGCSASFGTIMAPWQFVVARAHRYTDLTCEDAVPPTYFTVLFNDTPGSI
jgi:hypothetical protein